MKKIKLKKSKKYFKMQHMLMLFLVFIVSMGIAYAKLSTNLQIIGNVKGNVPMGNSQYTYLYRSSWPSGSNYTIHDVHICILNLDEDFSNELTISFEINEGFDLEASTNNINVWQAKEITQNGNIITMVLKEYASYLPIGSKIDFYFQLPYENSEILPEITKLTINGYRVNLVSEF